MSVAPYIPANYRRPIYGVFAGLGLSLTAAQTGFVASESGQPEWLTVALAVYAVIGTGIGYTAASNTTPDTDTDPGKHTDIDGDGQAG